jgi:hypothetical protein
MVKIGYARVSSTDQNLDRQIAGLRAEGCDKTFCQKASALPCIAKVLGASQIDDEIATPSHPVQAVGTRDDWRDCASARLYWLSAGLSQQASKMIRRSACAACRRSNAGQV